MRNKATFVSEAGLVALSLGPLSRPIKGSIYFGVIAALRCLLSLVIAA